MRKSAWRIRHGLSLIEIIAGLTVAAVVAAVSLQYLRPASDTSKQRACDVTRQLLQNDAQRYMETTGSLPSVDLGELQTAEFAGPVLPTCPISGESYTRGRTGLVGCPTHEATRVK